MKGNIDNTNSYSKDLSLNERCKDFSEEMDESNNINVGIDTIELLDKCPEEMYEKIIAIRPEDDLVLNNLAWLYLTAQDRQLRNLERAMELALKSVNVLPTIDNLDTLAEAYFQSGDTKKAVEIIIKAARDVDYSSKRHPYLRKQLLRFRNGDIGSNPPALS